jgi:hypothetical protein
MKAYKTMNEGRRTCIMKERGEGRREVEGRKEGRKDERKDGGKLEQRRTE